MVKIERIKGRVFVEQRTYYIYNNEDRYNKDQYSLNTSNEEMFNKQKKL